MGEVLSLPINTTVFEARMAALRILAAGSDQQADRRLSYAISRRYAALCKSSAVENHQVEIDRFAALIDEHIAFLRSIDPSRGRCVVFDGRGLFGAEPAEWLLMSDRTS